jgi:hypothetical protein
VETLIQTTDTLSGTNATTVETKDGKLTEQDTTIQDSQSMLELSSKSDQE